MRKTLRMLAFASGCAAAALAFMVPAGAQTMDEVLAGAKKEGQVRIAITVRPKEGNTVAAPRLIEAFEKKYPFVKVRYNRVGGTRERERIFTELASGMVNYDVATLSMTAIPDGLRAKIFRKVNWTGLGVSPDTANPDGWGVNYRVQLYGISYNTKLVSEADARAFTWDSCVDPRWKGKFALDMRPRHLEILYQDDGWGREKTLEHARKLADNKPVFEVDRAETQNKLVDGVYPFICGQFWSSHQRAAVGDSIAHLGFVAPEPVLINSGDVVFVPAGARNSFAGILWVLWSVSAEGLALLDEVQFTGDPTAPGMSSHSLLANKQVIRGTWANQINAQKTLGEILNTMGVPVVVEQ